MDINVNQVATKGLENRMLTAAESGDAMTVKRLLKKYVSPNVKDENGVSAIAKAVKGGHSVVVKYLLEMKATVNTANGILVTPLHIAASSTIQVIVLNSYPQHKFLSLSPDGRLVVEWAIGGEMGYICYWEAQGNYLDIVKLLIYYGANVDLRTKSGLRPVDLVSYNSNMWHALQDAARGIMPDITERSDVPEIPAFAISAGFPEKTKKTKKKGSKKSGGKRGKKKKKKRK